MDTNKEKDIEIGREWPYDTIKAGECVITSDLARQINVYYFVRSNLFIFLPLFR